MSDYKEKRGLKPFYMGLPIEVLRRIGETYREGTRYDKSAWDRYYQQELTPEDFLEVYNNAVEHLFNSYDEIVNGKVHNGGEDHLAHAVANLCMIMWATENGRLPNKLQAMDAMIGEEVPAIEEYRPELTPEVTPLAEPVKKSILDILKLNKKAAN